MPQIKAEMCCVEKAVLVSISLENKRTKYEIILIYHLSISHTQVLLKVIKYKFCFRIHETTLKLLASCINSPVMGVI